MIYPQCQLLTDRHDCRTQDTTQGIRRKNLRRGTVEGCSNGFVVMTQEKR